MNVNLLHEKLIRAARQTPPSDRVPYAFEKRILARIKTVRMMDGLTLWANALWKGAIPCVLVMLLLGALSTSGPEPASSAETTDLSAQLETTLMASVSADNDYAW